MRGCLWAVVSVAVLVSGCVRVVPAPGASNMDPASARYTEGKERYYRGAYEAAVDSYTGALALNPKLCQAHNDRGLAYQALEEPDLAIGDFDAAIRCYDEASGTPGGAAAGAYNNRGAAYVGKGDLVRGAVDFDKAAELDPGLGKAHYNRGLVFLATGSLDDALAAFNRALASASASIPKPTPGGPTGGLISQGMLDRYLKEQEDLARTASRAEVLVARARVYSAQGDQEQALADLNEAIRLDASLEAAYLARAAVLQRLGRQAEAIADLDVAVRFATLALTPAPTRVIDIVEPQPHPDTLRRRQAEKAAALAEALRQRGLAQLVAGNGDAANADLAAAQALTGDDLPAPVAATTRQPPVITPQPSPTLTQTPRPPDTAPAACEGKLLRDWAAPGRYSYSVSREASSGERRTESITLTRGQPAGAPLPERCPDMSHGFSQDAGDFGTRLSLPPVVGAAESWSCGSPYGASVRITGSERVTTPVGEFEALRIEGMQGFETYGMHDRYGAYLPHVQDQTFATEWWVCGYGLVQMSLRHAYDAGHGAGGWRSDVTLQSYTP